jgi:hypothetical protein
MICSHALKTTIACSLTIKKKQLNPALINAAAAGPDTVGGDWEPFANIRGKCLNLYQILPHRV